METVCGCGCAEPESLNGKVIQFMGRKATVVDFEPSTSIRTSSLRALHYEDNGEAKLVNLWAGTDYKIVGASLVIFYHACLVMFYVAYHSKCVLGN